MVDAELHYGACAVDYDDPKQRPFEGKVCDQLVEPPTACDGRLRGQV